MTPSLRRAGLVLGAGLASALPLADALAASHREAPLTAIDRTADITDWYAFVSPDAPDTVTMILAVDPLLEPGNGPNYFPFDDNLSYEFYVDNDQDARAGRRLPDQVQDQDPRSGRAGRLHRRRQRHRRARQLAAAGRSGNTAHPAGDHRARRDGLRGAEPAPDLYGHHGPRRQGDAAERKSGGPLFAVPSNVGPRTMPDYQDLMSQGIYDLDEGVRVFAGTTDDAFFIDLGAAFDSLNFRVIPGPTSTGIPAVLSDEQDAAARRFVSDDVSGYNVNTIALQVPIDLLTRHGNQPTWRSRRDHRTYGATFRQTDRAAPPGAADQGQRTLRPGAAHGQSPVQRADHRHRLQGSVEPLGAEGRCASSPTSRSIR